MSFQRAHSPHVPACAFASRGRDVHRLSRGTSCQQYPPEVARDLCGCTLPATAEGR